MLYALRPLAQRLKLPGIALVLGLALLFAGPPAAARAATITVTTTGGTIAPDGSCSLHEAIIAANLDAVMNECVAGSGTDTIEFHIPGSGVRTITVEYPQLPQITSPMTIDGWSQGVFDGTPGYAGPPTIAITGGAASPTVDGITIRSSNTTVRGLSIRGFPRWGISVSAVSNVVLQGNYVGVLPDGSTLSQNWGGIALVGSRQVTIGGTGTGEGNVVAGNQGGVPDPALGQINLTNVLDVTIQGNRIGTNSSGTAALPAISNGIASTGSTNVTIGGVSTSAHNIIGGATGVGYPELSGVTINSGTGHTIQGNAIGVGADGLTPTPNQRGITVAGGTGTLIGGTGSGAGNTIRDNVAGVVVTGAATTVQILGNQIFNNSVFGIDLGNDGLTANDLGDVDSGPNALQNYPALQSASTSSGGTTVSGTLNSTPNTTFRIESFRAQSCLAPGGQGQTLLDSFTGTTDSSGNLTFARSGLATVPVGGFVTATATNTSAGVTSEFSPCQTVVQPNVVVAPAAGLVTTEAGGTATFTVALTSIPGATVTIPVRVSDSTEGVVSPATLTFQPDLTALTPQTVTVTGLDDAIADGAVAYTVVLGRAMSGDPEYNGFTPSDVAVTNQDNDGTPTLAVGNAQVAEGNNSTMALRFPVTLTPASNQVVTVQYATADGTAIAGQDYQVASGTLTFQPGETSLLLVVLVIGDTVVEGNETLTLTLSNPSIGAVLGTATATGTIVDDEGAPTLSVSGGQVEEGDSGTTPLAFTVTLMGTSSQAIAVQYATADGTATAGQDYQAASGTLTFQPGEISHTVNVLVIGDTDADGDETFSLTLSNPTGGAVLGTASATGTIFDDEASAWITDVTIVTNPDGSHTLHFLVEMPSPGGQTLTFTYTILLGDDPGATTTTASRSAATSRGTTSRGTMADGTTVATGTVTFQPGETSQPVVAPLPANASGWLTIVLSGQAGRTVDEKQVSLEPTPAPEPTVKPQTDDDDKPRRRTETERQQDQRTNQYGLDQYRTEGNVTVVERTSDGANLRATIALGRGETLVVQVACTRGQCPDIQVGDYLEAEGEQGGREEQGRFIATDVTVRRGGQRVR
ncbi:MAG: hypothetical protein IT305_29580 [Chloroflexi bacterium]|nr:hypothetical protein [Chloroflexota bacterium]